MKNKTMVWKLISLGLAILSLAACGQQSSKVAQLAQSMLATQLDVPVENVGITSTKKVEWTDSCLGWGGPAESCAAVITPGWQIFFAVDGAEYEVRANQDGTIIRTAQP